ncbi:low temperature requirement protein A [Micromonospora sp. CA-263727]|uniref:low temperature requirement protein A n=1 Tax=Micromonospora sp. CA-263727 TaxID=3239967 RepID=UPI003D8A66B5
MSWVELFVDLIFVFAFLSVTTLMAATPGATGLIQGALIVLLLWHCWTSCMWLGNVIHLDRGIMPLVMVGVAAVLLVIAAAVPEAFGDRSGGLSGPVVVVTGYLLIRLTVLVVLTVFRWGQGESGRRPARLAWLFYIAGALLLLTSAVLPPSLPEAVNAGLVRLLLFGAALVVDSLLLVVIGRGSWQMVSGWHVADRHTLIVLIALGETIISIGASTGLGVERAITPTLVWAALLGIIVIFVLWWSYFDLASVIVQRALRGNVGADSTRLGRDVYSGLHLPMIAGLILFALGLKHASADVAGHHVRSWPFAGTTLLFGGVVLYLLALVAAEWRAVRLLGRGPLAGIALLLALLVIAANVAELTALLLLAAGACAMLLLDATVFRQRHRELHRSVEAESADGNKVSPRELFVDLVFVYAFIEVTALMSRFPTVLGLFQGLVVLALLWWLWISNTWLANAARSDTTLMRLCSAGIVAAGLLLGLAIPQTFAPLPGSLPGTLLVIGCYLFVTAVQWVVFWQVRRENPALTALGGHWWPSVATVLVLLVIAAIEWWAPDMVARHPAITLFWVAALLLQYVGGYRVGVNTWRLELVRHWTDRYALVVLIAFGEAILSIGVIVKDEPISGRIVVVVASSAIALSTLWWSYFTTIDSARDALANRPVEVRATVGRDAYTYLHLLMIAGIVLVAYGLQQTLTPGSERDVSRLGHYALFLGVALYLVGNQLFWRRIFEVTSRHRVIGACAVTVLAPLTIPLPSAVALVLLTALGVAFTLMEAAQSGDLRTRRPDVRPSR